jgi:hypothetical protein
MDLTFAIMASTLRIRALISMFLGMRSQAKPL